jgi:selenide,water dikinase
MEVLKGLPLGGDGLLVGPETLDDAGVYELDENTALIQTVDYFTPLVDDPYDFGAIAAANALSDVYAMGGKPLTALAIMCFPAGSAPLSVMREIILGGLDKVREAGAAVAGGHSVVDKEIKFGFAVTGIVHPSRLTQVGGARPGDELVLTKPIGTGVLAHVLKREGLPAEVNEAFLESMKMLNAAACEAMVPAGARACTDVTGFGLLGHALNMARGGGVSIEIAAGEVPTLPMAEDAAARDMLPGGLKRNRSFVSPHVESRVSGPLYDLLCDPQTSGGLLIAVPSGGSGGLLDALGSAGVAGARRIGVVEEKRKSFLFVI